MAGSAAYQDENEGGTISDINVTPLVDVVLVLLIVFMITVPTIVSSAAIKVDLPSAVAAKQPAPATPLTVTIGRDPFVSYILYANGKRTTEDGLSELLPQLLAKNPELTAVVAADKGIIYDDVVHVVNLLSSLGVRKFAMSIAK